MNKKLFILGLLVTTPLVGCTSTTELLNDNQTIATTTATNHAQFEMSCNKITTTVLNRKTIDLYRRQVPQYEIGVTGCEKKEIYIVNCNPESGCMVYNEKQNQFTSTVVSDRKSNVKETASTSTTIN